jgi:GTP cyclohydrolase II
MKTHGYDWKNVHEDVNSGIVMSSYGGDNIAYHALTEAKTGIDLHRCHEQKSKDEVYNESLVKLLDCPQIQENWKNIVTLDPLGMYAKRPTIAAISAKLDLRDVDVKKDGVIVNKNGTINTTKIAVEQVWNIKKLAERIKTPEDSVRKSLYKYHNNPNILDKNLNVYLPSIGGISIFCFGDISKLSDKNTKVAVRVHDACLNSDCFRGTICTCAPYLMFAIEQCVKTAQEGGVGIIAYFRKEGRALGEVVKFRVYGARTAQEGGDTADKYFYQTESIAGIKDSRHQELMPDVLLWLGIKRIDYLLSMSNEKYDAIISLGIKVINRIELPDSYIHEDSKVEITAKIASGYFSNIPVKL